MRFSPALLPTILASFLLSQLAYASFIDHPVHSGKWTDEYDRHFKKYRTLDRKFKKTAEQDKLYMPFASYNAGYGRILNAAKRIDNKDKEWDQIKHYLPRETQGYVRRIRKLMGDH